MKRKFLFIYYLIFLLFSISLSANTNILADEDDVDDIELKGEIADEHRIRSLEKDVIATKTKKYIDVIFFVDCNVSITLTDSDGNITYTNYIDTETRKTVRIDISGWVSSSYKIEIENQDNHKIAYGHFMVL